MGWLVRLCCVPGEAVLCGVAGEAVLCARCSGSASSLSQQVMRDL